MIRRAARITLALLAAATLAAGLWRAAEIARSPAFHMLAERSAAEIRAATDRMIAHEATPERLAARLGQRLAESPRNWIALDGLTEVAAERCAATPCDPWPPALAARLAAARAADFGPLARVEDCAACAWDPAACRLDNVAICQLPVALTVLGDLAGIARAGVAYAGGEAVDGIDLGLSVAGLGATALAVASGGTSLPVKLGAGTARLARQMNLVSPRLAAEGTAALRRAARADIAASLSDLGRMRAAADTAGALHLIRFADDAGELRRLSRTAEALGPRTAGRLEVLGKARLLRATLRISALGWQLIGTAFAITVALASLAAGMGQAAGLRILRRLAR